MDTTLVYSRINLIKNLKCLWFITKRHFSVSFPSIPTILPNVFVATKHYSSTPKTDEIFHCNFVRQYDITLEAEVRLNNKNTLICAVNNVI